MTPSPPIRWRTTTGEPDDFAAALKNLDVPYDYVFEVGVAQLERFNEQQAPDSDVIGDLAFHVG